MIVKLFLIASILAAAVWLVRARPGGNQLALTRLASVAFVVSWMIAVIAPNGVTWLANSVGVGRGADLLLYLMVVAFTFTTIAQHKRLRALDDRLTDLARANALLRHEVESISERAPENRD